jgi:predicted NBD/HSP70 family sugar kinase
MLVAGIDLGGTAVNFTLLNDKEEFLIDGLCEHPARATEGPAICIQQIADGLKIACDKAGVSLDDISVVGLDTPGPASATGVLSKQGATNFLNSEWGCYDIPANLSKVLGKPVTYLNDANAAALWGHFSLFGTDDKTTSISCVIGTGHGGGIIMNGEVIIGRVGYGGELGHVLIPWQMIEGLEGLDPACNCGRNGDLESLCSLTSIRRHLLPHFLKKYPTHELASITDPHKAAYKVRGLAEKGDEMCKKIFQVEARALGIFFDMMVNTFDPDAFIVGGGAIETGPEFQKWFIDEIRLGMGHQRDEQADIPIHIMPNGDTAGARGAALEALKFARAAK